MQNVEVKMQEQSGVKSKHLTIAQYSIDIIRIFIIFPREVEFIQ